MISIYVLILVIVIAFVCGFIFGLVLMGLVSANKYDEICSEYQAKVEEILNDRSRKDS